MNKRIDELFGQAMDKAFPETWTSLNNEQLMRLKEKFSELIVQDCVYAIELVKQYRYDRYDPLATQKTIVEECQYQIKQYFGIEE